MSTKQFPGRYDSLIPISDFVAEAAGEAGFDSQETYAICLAVDEACSNIIEHGYGGEDRGEIRCTCDVLEDRLKITIQDWGRIFDPDAVPPPDFSLPLEELEPRGAGLFLMRKIMDDVRFELGTRAGNILVMVKNR